MNAIQADKKMETLANKVELMDLFHVEIVDGKKSVNRWGFFAKQADGMYAIYKPELPICEIGDEIPEEDGPGAIDTVEAHEIHNFLRSIGHVEPIAWMDLDQDTPCGWYYDTIVPMEV